MSLLYLVKNTAILAWLVKVSLICELPLLSYSPPKSRDSQTNNWRKTPLNDWIDFPSTSVSCKRDDFCKSFVCFSCCFAWLFYSQELKTWNWCNYNCVSCVVSWVARARKSHLIHLRSWAVLQSPWTKMVRRSRSFYLRNYKE